MKLIDKDKVAEDIKRRIDDEMEIIKKFTHPFYATEITRCNARVALLKQLQDFLDTLKTKDVDLEKEYEEFVVDDPILGNFITNDAMGMELAKHFFELGLKTKEK